MFEELEDRLDAITNHHKTIKKLMTETNDVAKESLGEDFENSKIIVNPFLDHHYTDKNGKIFVYSLDKALRIAKNGDAIFLKNGKYDLGQTVKDGKMLEKNVTIIGESTNETFLNLTNKHYGKIGEVQFRRLNIKIGPHLILVSEGKISFESCLVDARCDVCFALYFQAEIDLRNCCFTSAVESIFISLINSDSTIKINISDCFFEDFKFIIFKKTQVSGGFELLMASCSFLGIKGSVISLFPPSQKEPLLTYPTSVVIRNCFVEAWPKTDDISLIMNISNACHVLIESTKFISKKGDPSRVNTSLQFADIQRVEIINTIVTREGNDQTLACLRTYLEKSPKEGTLDDAAIQLAAVQEATIRDSIFKGFYYGITTKSRVQDVNKDDKICFTGVYNCQLSNLAVCVLLDSRFTSRSIFVLSDISFRDSLVGVRVSEMCCRNGSVDVLDDKFTDIPTPIVVPKVLKKDDFCVKDEKKNSISRIEMKKLTFPDGGPQNVSRKKRRDGVIMNLLKAGILDSTISIPYLEPIFKPKGDWLEIADEKDLQSFNFKVSSPQSTSDYQSDCEDSVD